MSEGPYGPCGCWPAGSCINCRLEALRAQNAALAARVESLEGALRDSAAAMRRHGFDGGLPVWIDALLRPAAGKEPAKEREPFEVWHARECPGLSGPISGPYRDEADGFGICGPIPVKWAPRRGPRWDGRTCREVYDSEVPGAPRAPSDGVSGKPAGRPSPAGGDGLPAPTGTNPAEELAEAYCAERDAAARVTACLRPRYYHDDFRRENAAYPAFADRLREAEAKYREGRGA